MVSQKQVLLYNSAKLFLVFVHNTNAKKYTGESKYRKKTWLYDKFIQTWHTA